MASINKTIKRSWSITSGGWSATEGYRGVLITAAIFDLLSAIPWVGVIFSFTGYAIIWLTLEVKGISANPFSRGAAKKVGSILAEFGFGFIGLGIVPGILLWTYFTITSNTESESEPEKSIKKINLPQYTSRVKTSRF